jgi:arylsulfatase
LTLGACCRALPTPERIVLISLDTLRADYLNVYGYEKFRTSPFLDSFAEENVLFEACIVVEPFTLTSHMSLLTGLLPQHHQVRGKTVLPEGIRTLASALREAGHRTQAFVDGVYMDRHWGFDEASRDTARRR